MRTRVSATAGSIFGKLIFSAFGLFFAGIGTMFIKQELASLQETKAMQQWIETPCTIVSSEMRDDGEDYKLVVSYSYSFNGLDYTATRYGRTDSFYAVSVVEIDRLRKQLSPGTATRCHINPENPEEAVLERPSVEGAIRGIGFTLIFPAFGLFFAIIPWLVRDKKQTATEPVQKGKSGKRFMILFGAVFTLAGLGFTGPFVIRPLQKSQNAKSWNTIPATVVSSKVKSHSDDDGTTYSVYIAYRYKVNGKEFIGDQYTFMGGSSSGYAGKAEIVRQYPTGRKFNVFVNPANPEESVIVRELGNDIFFGLIPLLFTVIGIVIIIGAFHTKRLDMKQATQHSLTLKGKSPVGKAVGITLFTVAWSGIVVFLIKSDAPLLFPFVFGLADIVIICCTIYQILAIFNPRPVVELSPGNIHPGTKITLRWQMTGNTERIGTLTVQLKCLKVTTETRRNGGKTSTTVVKKPLCENVILRSENKFEINRGTASIIIPEDRPASRLSNDDGIQWQIEFHGDISRWPDLKQEFPFIVYPAIKNSPNLGKSDPHR